MIYMITEKAQIILPYLFVYQKMFNKEMFSIFCGFKVEYLPCTPVRAGSCFMTLLRIVVNPTTGACIPLAPETVFSNVLYLYSS